MENSSNQTRCPSGPVTFGVEVEAVIAFSQTQLQSVLTRYYHNRPKIVKALPDSAHAVFLGEEEPSHNCRGLYPSWVLEVPIEEDRSLQLVARQATSITGREGKVRKYLAEPLIIAKEAIEEAEIPVEIRAQLRRGAATTYLSDEEKEPACSVILQAQSASYSGWTLTTDHTLVGCIQDQLYEVVGNRLYHNNEKQWDSSGFELISPVFNYMEKAAAFKSIENCLTQLSEKAHHTILPSKWAALQVHVGLDLTNPWGIPLHLLQHLAYILLCHEDLLSKLHPRSRCGLPLRQGKAPPEELYDETEFEDYDPDAPLPPEKTPAEIAAEDELYRLENDERVIVTETNYTGYNTTNSNARFFCRATSSVYPPTSQHVAKHIFTPDITLTQLISLLQRPSNNSSDAIRGYRYRGYMYNFDNILSMHLEDTNTWKKGKPTIEFRQHACSVDADEIRRWVELCFAIVKLAQRMAEEDAVPQESDSPHTTGSWEEQERKYVSYGREWPCTRIEDLLGKDFVGLDQDDVNYWVGRYECYKDDRPMEGEVDPEAI